MTLFTPTKPSRISAVLTTVLMVAVALAVTPASEAQASSPCSTTGATGAYAGGAGTSGAPYLIATAAQLALLSATSADWGKYFEQTANIDLGGCQFNPIGGDPVNFTGQYDGGFFAISGLNVVAFVSAGGNLVAGLFGFAREADFKNIKVIGATVAPATPAGAAGILVGRGESISIDNVVTSGTVTNSDDIGGLVGLIRKDTYSSTILNSYSSATVSGTGTGVAGGLVGRLNETTLSNSYSRGAVTGAGNVGGLVGSTYGGTVTNAFFDEQTSGQTDDNGLGTPQSTADMTSFSAFTAATWDIVDGWAAFAPNETPAKIWGICSLVNGYPFLLWEYSSDPCLSVATAPTITSITTSSGSLSVVFTAPTSDGGFAITNYKYSTDNGVTWVTRSPSATTSPLVIQGLINGTTYQIKLLAVNSVGEGLASNEVPGTPVGSSSSSAPVATALATTGTTTTNYLAVVPLFLAVGGLLVWLGRGRRSEAELQ